MSKAISLAVAGALALTFWSADTWAQATRTWVSGVGDDANPCSRTAPCKTFAGAISKTQSGGEIDALDPGGFGGLTITKTITIDGGGGQIASVLVSGTSGIVIEAGANDVVTLRNLRVNGIGAGLDGIKFLSGAALHVQNCFVFGFTGQGINVASIGTTRTMVTNTTVHDNGGGFKVAPTSGTAFSTFIEVNAEHNGGTGFLVDGTVGGATNASISRSSAVENGTGIESKGAVVLLGDSVVVGNATGVNQATPGNGGVFSYKTNIINNNNVADGTPLSPIGLN